MQLKKSIARQLYRIEMSLLTGWWLGGCDRPTDQLLLVMLCAGHTWSVPDSVMSLTFIAAGSSVPDVIASLIVVRDGTNTISLPRCQMRFFQ